MTFDGTFWLIHGWRTRGRNMERLAAELRALGFKVRVIRYGRHFWRWHLLQGMFNALVALIGNRSKFQDGDVIVGHSNGANLSHKAMRLGLKPGMCIWLSPALDECLDTDDYADEISRIEVWHTKSDWAVRFAKLVWASDWGAAGAHGYQGSNPIIHNRDMTRTIRGHSGWFDCVPVLARWLKDSVEAWAKERVAVSLSAEHKNAGESM